MTSRFGGRTPSSSSNSRCATSSGSSPDSYSPFGIDQAASFFLDQNGPPGCTSRNSMPPAPSRYIRIPALSLDIPGLFTAETIAEVEKKPSLLTQTLCDPASWLDA